MQIIDRIVSRSAAAWTNLAHGRCRLPDGSRVNAIIPPLALDGPAYRFAASGTNPLPPEHGRNRP